ncbi:hypothetical protein JCM5353_001173 [Sporobolomyces roseus]
MDRLPLELLRLISTFIEQEPIPRIRQGALAALSRINRTWYSIVNSRLYLKPVLFNEKRAKQWSIVYSSRITPWTVNEGNGSLQNIIVPESIVFKRDRKVDKINVTNNSIFPRLESPLASSHLFQVALAPFFFRNLTSFSVSQGYPINAAFVVGLLGPTAHTRHTIKKLKIQSEGAPLIWFLFEAIRYLEHQIDPAKWFSQQLLDVTGAEVGLERGKDIDQVSEEDWMEMEDVARDLAHVDWSAYELMLPEEPSDDEYYEEILGARVLPPTPFSQLRVFVLDFKSVVELRLCFLINLFPSLRYLTLRGELRCSDHLENDITLLRLSIFKRKGVILPPYVDAEVIPFYPNLFDTWGPLSKIEWEDYAHKPYQGPKLKKLDLSGCRIVLPSDAA